MILGILSDTHDELVRTQVALRMLSDAGAAALVHCGDLSSPPLVTACAVLPCWFVFGNHDADAVPHLRREAERTGVVCLGWGGTFELCGKRIGVVHGHLTTDLNKVLAEKPDLVLSGHSHLPSDSQQGAVRRINPGALFRAETFTVATLDLKTGALRTLQVHDC